MRTLLVGLGLAIAAVAVVVEKSVREMNAVLDDRSPFWGPPLT